MDYVKIVDHHEKLLVYMESSTSKLKQVREEFESAEFFQDVPITIFSAGSLARGEWGDTSDLDLFVVSESNERTKSRIFEIELFAELVRINNKLGFPQFSNDGEYLKIYPIDELLAKAGSPKDDSENFFTARMLLILESDCLVNRDIYENYLGLVIDHYFRDEKGKETFRPLYLINDLLRYWRTLCLNYEGRRKENKPWRKKNVSLKFSRMLTVFSTILPLVSRSNVDKEYVLDLVRRRPLQRLAIGFEQVNDSYLDQKYMELLDLYSEFLSWKERDLIEDWVKQNKDKVEQNAHKFSDILYLALTNGNINKEYQKYLMI